MTNHETEIYNALHDAVARGFATFYIERLDAIRLYNKHGVTVRTIELRECSEEAQNEFFDIII